jgi:hypothetical protein
MRNVMLTDQLPSPAGVMVASRQFDPRCETLTISSADCCSGTSAKNWMLAGRMRLAVQAWLALLPASSGRTGHAQPVPVVRVLLRASRLPHWRCSGQCATGWTRWMWEPRFHPSQTSSAGTTIPSTDRTSFCPLRTTFHKPTQLYSRHASGSRLTKPFCALQGNSDGCAGCRWALRK